MCHALFLFGTANALTARRLSSGLIRVSGRFATKSTRFKSFRYNSTVDSPHIRSKHKSRFATETYKLLLDTNFVMINKGQWFSQAYRRVLVISEDLVCLISSTSERMNVTISDYVKL